MTEATPRRANWLLWAGFLLSLLAFFSYFFVFVRYPVTRDFPWANLVLFALAETLLAVGVIRAFRSPQIYRGKIVGPSLSALGTLVLCGFVFVVFIFSHQLPASSGAPRVGTKVPDFTLPDTNNNPVTLSELLAAPVGGVPARGVLLVFYRGYW